MKKRKSRADRYQAVAFHTALLQALGRNHNPIIQTDPVKFAPKLAHALRHHGTRSQRYNHG